MSEFDTILCSNPTEQDFTVNYNGEPYKIAAGDSRHWVIPVARHFAKHLSDKILIEQFAKKRTAKVYKENPKLRENDPEKIQYTMLDNPQRRIALYRILKSKKEVEEVIKHYPQFKANVRAGDKETMYSFTGDMKEYDDFVVKYEQDSAKESKSAPSSDESKKAEGLVDSNKKT